MPRFPSGSPTGQRPAEWVVTPGRPIATMQVNAPHHYFGGGRNGMRVRPIKAFRAKTENGTSSVDRGAPCLFIARLPSSYWRKDLFGMPRTGRHMTRDHPAGLTKVGSTPSTASAGQAGISPRRCTMTRHHYVYLGDDQRAKRVMLTRQLARTFSPRDACHPDVRKQPGDRRVRTDPRRNEGGLTGQSARGGVRRSSCGSSSRCSGWS